MREPVNDKHPARRDRRRVRRRGSRGTPDHDARRAHAIDDPRRDRGRRDARDDVEDDAPIVGDHE